MSATTHGRENQLYDGDGRRKMAACVPVTGDGMVLMITSRKHHDEWILPKGGWEKNENADEGASRETWEEAGVKGSIVGFVGCFEEEDRKKKKLPLLLHFYEMNVTEVAEHWPEEHERQRKWMAGSSDSRRRRPKSIQFISNEMIKK